MLLFVPALISRSVAWRKTMQGNVKDKELFGFSVTTYQEFNVRTVHY
jgi:hypothetical protein